MNRLLFVMVMFCHGLVTEGQDSTIIKVEEWRLETRGLDDSLKMNAFLELGRFYIDIDNDSSMLFARNAYLISLRLKSREYEGQCLDFMGAVALRRGNTDQAIEFLLKGLKIFESIPDSTYLIVINRNLAGVYKGQRDYFKAREYYSLALNIKPKSAQDSLFRSWALMDFGDLLMSQNQNDSALMYARQSFDMGRVIHISYADKYLPIALNTMGRIYQKAGKYDMSLEKYRQAVLVALSSFNQQAASDNYLQMAILFREIHAVDSGFYYAKKAFYIARQVNNPQTVEASSNYLKDYYKDLKLYDSAFVYQEIMDQAKDSLLSLEKIHQVQNFSFNEQLKQGEIKARLLEYRNSVKTIVLLSGIGVLLLIALVLFRNNRLKQSAKAKIEKAYQELKVTQAQLIQSEKMASLGELTAGIAHEIQNPLNFVNNFSEVNMELIDELKNEIDAGNTEQIKSIVTDLEQNTEKITHHGKRADAIVKGMLQHSRKSTGQKEPTDINALAAEYLRLSYQGLRARDKTFNAVMETRFEEGMGKINIVPQDLGRVLLNLYNNAFYAISERANQDSTAYEPAVTVTTARVADLVEISVKDNGTGIPQKVLDKIFQPFFTTKPTGQGTGLGLSLSYDIINAQGGELKVETQEGVGTEFILRIPVT